MNSYPDLKLLNAKVVVQGVKRGGCKNTSKEKQQDVTILDVYENTANVVIIASDWFDYSTIAKSHRRWVILNVLWELKPQKLFENSK